MTTTPATSTNAGVFEALYQQAPFGYLVTDHNDVVVRVNATFLDWGSFDESHVVGKPFRDLLSAGAQLLYETRHLPLVRLQGYSNEVMLQLVTADGSLLPVLVNAASVDVFGEPREVRIGVLNASSRVSYERELLSTQRSAESMAARIVVLQNASVAFASSSSEAEIVETLSTITEDALAASGTCVALIRPSGQLEVVAGTNMLEGLLHNDAVDLGTTVLNFETPVTVTTVEENLQRFPAVVAALRAARLRTVAVYPIKDNGEPIGVVAAFFGRERTLAESEDEMVLSLARQATQVLTRMRVQDQLAYAALHDQLTGLANRALIRQSITVGLAAANECSEPLSLMFLDLDGFKNVNDRLGHQLGDDLLIEVSKRLTASTRGSDIVGRYGGDEFVVICASTGPREADAISQRIHAEMRRPFAQAVDFDISASIGIAVHEASDKRVSMDELITAADASMYESKRLGRDRTTRVVV